MPSDRQAPGRLIASQRRQLRDWMRRELPLSAHYRAVLGPEWPEVRDVSDLSSLPVTRLERVADPASLVMRPTEALLLKHGSSGLRSRVVWARLTGRPHVADRDWIEPRYKPLRWVVADGVPLGYTATDLDLLAEIGRRQLVLAGVRRSDAVVSILPVGPSLPWTQLDLGTRRAGVGLFPLATAPTLDELAALGPAVMAGRPADLELALDRCADAGVELPHLHTLVVVGRPDGSLHRRLATRSAATPVWAWAPPGVRALWSGCRPGGPEVGLHLWPEAGIVEATDPTSNGGGPEPATWTSVGWRGSALVRLDTGEAMRLDHEPCPACGRTTPRVLTSS